MAALLVSVGLLAAACGGAGANGNDGDDLDGGAASDPSSTTSTTRPVLDTALPLLPATTTTLPDPMVDPPPAVPDPGPPPGRNSVFVMGDSVFLGTTSAIPQALPEWLVTYDAVGSRRLAQAIDVFTARRDEIGEAVVVHLGNNFIEGERGTYATQIDEAMAVLADVPRVVWVTVSEVSPSRVAINEAIREAATRWPNLRVADWAPIIATFPGLTWDGLHLTPDGRREMATLIAGTLGPIDYP